MGPELIRDAAKETVKVADLLVVCGFAFDPMADVSDEAWDTVNATVSRPFP